MKKILLIFMCCIAATASASPYNLETERILAQLDSILPLRRQYEQNKLKRIAALKATAAQRNNDAERVWDYSKLYDEYFTYDSDSAHKYVDLNLEIAQKLNDSALETEWNIKKALLLVNTGLMGTATDIAAKVRSSIKPEFLTDYYNLMFGLNFRLSQYSDGSPDIQKDYLQACWSYRDSIMAIIRPDHPDYLRFKVGAAQTPKEVEAMVATVENELAQSSLSTRNDAMNAMSLAKLYLQLHNTDKYIQSLARSAIADIRATNSDIDSLDELSQALFEIGDLEHAYLYITTCLNIIRTYGNRVHLLRLTAIQEDINKAYIAHSHQLTVEARRLSVSTSILSVILLALAIVVACFMVKYRNNRKELNEKNLQQLKSIAELEDTHEKLNKTHLELAKANDELVKLNTQLQEANFVKEEYIGYVFSICSNYISKLDEFRKDINRKAKTNLFNEIKAMTNSSTIVQNELKEFYQNFDAIFLNIYPNFVADFNSLLFPEYQFNLKEGDGLNTELRIFALVKLGITDCVKISEFLHCSAQTVYNYRLRIRNHSHLPDKKEFAEAVQSIGKATVI